jgi:glutamate dehydrogenase
MWAFQMIMNTGLPDSASARPFLDGYFPRRLRESFADYFQEHALRREIVATGAVNYIINNGGIALLRRLTAGSRVGIGEAVTAWLDVDRAASAPTLRAEVLAAGFDARPEHEVLLEIEETLESAARNVLDGVPVVQVADILSPVRVRLNL